MSVEAVQEKEIVKSRVESHFPVPKEYNIASYTDCLIYQSRVLTAFLSSPSFQDGVSALLEAGLRRFNADTALLTRPVSNVVHEVLAFAGSGNFYVGQHISAKNSPCEMVFRQNAATSCPDLKTIGVNFQTLSYTVGDVGAYLGTVVKPIHASPGVMCFLATEARQQDHSNEDMLILELLAEGAAAMADQQTMQTQKKLTDQAMFALGSVKTLDEYLEQARLPEVFGVPARVVEVLQERIGHAPLSIGHIAEELNLSKRTLQRRLQQQEVNFAELRDQVRFHYSIDYLIKQQLSIDSISASLDFSDRTSFTNAFKRWTGLSPSTFRKLFRDYV